MKPSARCWTMAFVAFLALCPLRAQAQGLAEYSTALGAIGNVGAQASSALGTATKQAAQTVQKNISNPTPANLDAHRKTLTGKATKNGASTVHIDSTPSGALVSVDNLAVAHTPAHLTLPKGIHVIQVSHDGYISWQKSVLLGEGEKLSLNPALKDVKTSKPIFTVQR